MLKIMMLAAAIAGSDWIGVSIETGKRSEAMSQRYFHSEEECRGSTSLIGGSDDRVCFPVPALPKEIWDRQDAADRKELDSYYANCVGRAKLSWTEAGEKEALDECELHRPAD